MEFQPYHQQQLITVCISYVDLRYIAYYESDLPPCPHVVKFRAHIPEKKIKINHEGSPGLPVQCSVWEPGMPVGRLRNRHFNAGGRKSL